MLRCAAAFAIATLMYVSAQTPPRLAELISKGISALDKGKYNEALNALQEVWEQDRGDPAVAENLAMAYLYADHDVDKARALAEESIGAGGRASFLVQHSHERVAMLSGDMADYCTGRLSVRKDGLSFVASDQRHSFAIEKNNFREIKVNRLYGSERGMYHIRTLDKRNYNLRPRTWSEQETRLVFYLVGKYVDVSGK